MPIELSMYEMSRYVGVKVCQRRYAEGDHLKFNGQKFLVIAADYYGHIGSAEVQKMEERTKKH